MHIVVHIYVLVIGRPEFRVFWKAQSPIIEERPEGRPGIYGRAQAQARFLEPDPSVKCINTRKRYMYYMYYIYT